MGQNNLFKVICAFAFVALASWSCWATEESLHLLLPNIPQVLVWIVVIAFFILASLGTKLIVDSLNQNVYIEKRGGKLLGGIFMVIVFWLIFSMPTNTHTFFYRNAISSIASDDITTTEGYLDQLRNNTLTENKILAAQNQVRNQVWTLFGELEAEIKNDANPGFGPNARRILAEFATLLQVEKIDPLSNKGTTVSEQQRQKLIDAYRTKINLLLENRLLIIRNSMIAPDENTYKSLANTDWKNINAMEKAIASGEADLNIAEDVNDLNNRLVKGYSTIKNYQQYIDFVSNDDKEQYAPANGNSVTKVKKMLSVFDVWKDFLKGKYKGHGLIIWVILSILVDLGAFIFFDIAFKKDQYTI